MSGFTSDTEQGTRKRTKRKARFTVASEREGASKVFAFIKRARVESLMSYPRTKYYLAKIKHPGQRIHGKCTCVCSGR